MYPERHGVYRDIAAAQTFLRKLDDVKETLIKWAEVEPQDPIPEASLSALLMQQGDGSGALDAAQAAIPRLPQDQKREDRYQLLFGPAPMRAGTACTRRA